MYTYQYSRSRFPAWSVSGTCERDLWGVHFEMLLQDSSVGAWFN